MLKKIRFFCWKIIKSILSSDEPKVSKALPPNRDNLSVSQWMKRDWNILAEKDVKYFIRSVDKQTDEEFWKSGKKNCDQILGINTSRYKQIFENKTPKKMRVLEIGCGIGRILIPMSRVFGEAYGLDVSEKMIEGAKKNIQNIPNCKVFANSGSNLSMFSDDYFDFCYSIIVFQHIPEKEVIINYIKEVSRVLKTGCLFRFQVFGETKWKPNKYNTWYGTHFTSEEIHKIAEENKFQILEESGQNDQYYWLTFKSVK